MNMLLTTLGLFCAGVGVAVVAANPRRFTNQVFGAMSLLVACWMWSVVGAIRAGDQYGVDHSISPVPWLRANGVIAGLMMWVLSVLNYSIVTTAADRRAAARRLALLFVTVLIYSAVVCSESYIPTTSSPEHRVRGLGYIFCIAASFVWQLGMLVAIGRQLHRHTGIRRVELQFLSQNLTVAMLLMLLATSVGNQLELPWLKRGSLLVFFGAFLLAAWALTLHRVYDARQIVLSLLQRVAVVTSIAAIAVAIREFASRMITTPWDLVIGVALCIWPGFWLDRRSRYWLKLDGAAAQAELGAALDGIARSVPDRDRLTASFEGVLREHFGADFATIMFERENGYIGGDIALDRNHDVCRHLIPQGWLTPESAARRSHADAQRLGGFLAAHRIGALVTVTADKPAMMIAVGTKRSGWAFTYPEMRRLQSAAETIDNVFTHFRLATEKSLQTKVEKLATVSRTLADDLKNLLAPVSTYLANTEGADDAGSPEQEVHSAARRSVRIMDDYVRETLFFSDHLKPRFEEVSIRELCDAAREVCALRAAERRVLVRSAVTQDIVLRADRVLMQRALVNLLSNAIDASRSGQAVRLAVRSESGRLQLDVIDNGTGIAPEYLHRVFEPFYTTKTFGDHVRGVGLGLTICEKIVRLHNGSVSLHSTLGAGTTARIQMPIAQRTNQRDGAQWRTEMTTR